MKGVIEEKVSTTQADACEQRVMKIPPGRRYDLADKSASRAIIEPRAFARGRVSDRLKPACDSPLGCRYVLADGISQNVPIHTVRLLRFGGC